MRVRSLKDAGAVRGAPGVSLRMVRHGAEPPSHGRKKLKDEATCIDHVLHRWDSRTATVLTVQCVCINSECV